MYEIYVCDTETTGIDLINCDIIELSLIRFKTNEQKTWHLKPLNFDAIEDAALRINGHKREDLEWKTAYGRETYKDPSEVIVEIENWIMTDNVPSENRIFVAHNVAFDFPRLNRLWQKCNEEDSFPFGRRSVDTMALSFFLDWCKENMAEGYSLKNLVKKYKLHNEKAHTAEADTKVTAEVFKAQIAEFKETISGGDKNLIEENKSLKLENEKMKSFFKNLAEGALDNNASSLISDELYKYITSLNFHV